MTFFQLCHMLILIMIKVEGNETITKKTKAKQNQAWKALPHYKQGNRLPQDAKIVPYNHLMLCSSVQLLGFLGGCFCFCFFFFPLMKHFQSVCSPYPCYCSVPALSFLSSPCHRCNSNPCQAGQRQVLCPCGSPTAAFLMYCLASNPPGYLSRLCPQQLCKEPSSQVKIPVFGSNGTCEFSPGVPPSLFQGFCWTLRHQLSHVQG